MQMRLLSSFVPAAVGSVLFLVGPALHARPLAPSSVAAGATTQAALDPLPTGWGPHGKPLYYFMVFSNASPGQDAELNRWYDRIHAPIMIESGDFVWAQRFMLSPVQLGGGGSSELKMRRYLVIFAIETDDIEKVRKDADTRMLLPRNIASRSLDYGSLRSITMEAIGPPVTQKDAQRLLKQEEEAGRVPRPGQPAPSGSYNPLADLPKPSDQPPTP